MSLSSTNEASLKLLMEYFTTKKNAREFLICPIGLLAHVAALTIGSGSTTNSNLIQFYFNNNTELAAQALKNLNNLDLIKTYYVFKDPKKELLLSDYKDKIVSARIDVSQEIFNLDLINKLNEKIKDDTKGVFSNVLNSDMIKSDMIGINTVFFEDEWLYRFSTKLEDFTKFNSTKQKIDFLTLNDAMNIEYNDEANDNLGVFSLKYRGKSGIKQLIFYQKQDIEDWNVFKNSTLSLLKEVLSTEFKFKTATGQSIIKMPKFKTEVSINFRDELNESEGLKHLFDKAADYSNMYKIPLRVSTLFQKAMFENNEKGTKAAAVTVVAMTRMAIIKKPIEKMEFIVNRTFAYALIDSEKNLLFVGVYDGKN